MRSLMTKSSPLLFAILSALCFPGNAGATEFTSRDYRVGDQPGVVAVADFNGDGKLDLAVLNGGSRNVSILLGNGDGTFQAAKNYDVGGDNPPSIVVADFNGDGKPDLAVAIPGNIPAPATTFPTCTQSSVNLLLGNGDGTFQTARRAVTVDSANLSVTAGDLNEDGKADLVVARSQIDPACPLAGGSVLLGNGDGSFQTAKEVAAAPGVLIADFNSDGKPDLLAWEPFNSPSGGILLGNGDGTFQPPLALPLPSGCGLFCRQVFSGFATGDFNGDSKLDIAFERGTRRCITCTGFPFVFATMVMLGNGDGKFQTATGVGNGGSFLLSGDFNGDGKPDIAFGSGDVQGFHVLLGKGNGTFPSLLAFDTGSGPVSFTVAELNGDHLPDVVLANMNDDTVSIAVNMSPTSGADLSVQVKAGPEPVSVTQNLTYTIPVINSGPQDATNVTLKDTLLAGVNFVSATITQGSCTQASLVVTCNVAKLVSGDAAVATIVVVPTTTGTASNTASVSATESDLVSGNNGASHSTRVDPMFALKVTKSGAGSGTVNSNPLFGPILNPINCGSTCAASEPTGTLVNLQVLPDAGSVFGGWGGACGPPNNAPGCDLTMNQDQAVTATFDVGPNFFLSADASSLTLKRGSSVITNISLLPEGNSFDSPIALTCAVDGPGAKPSCGLSPTSLTPGTEHVVSMLTISAPALAAALNRRAEPGSAGPLHAAWLLPGLALLGIASGSRKTKARGRQRLLLCGLLAGMLAWQAGCGGGSNTPPPSPPLQTFTVTVTAMSGTISKTAPISVTVQ